jgi:hypothetical protein
MPRLGLTRNDTVLHSNAGATILMTLGVPDPIVRKVTGHGRANSSGIST